MCAREDEMEKLLSNPALSVLGLLLLIGVLLAPLALRVAGLSGAQVVELLRSTMGFILEVVREFRSQNGK